jgi:hypothetical protein
MRVCCVHPELVVGTPPLHRQHPSITRARMRQIELDVLTQREFDMITNTQFTDNVHDESPTG